MSQLNGLIKTAADYKVVLVVDNKPFLLLTLDSASWNIAREQETIYAIGDENPIGEKRNAAKYTGKLTLQAGELGAICQLSGYNESTQITNATLAITSIDGLINRVFGGVNINTESLDIKAKDKQTLINTDWNGLSVA